MNKIYLEMSETERVLSRIDDDLEWAGCMLIEGIYIDRKLISSRSSVEEVIRLQKKAEKHLRKAQGYIHHLAKIAEENEE